MGLPSVGKCVATNIITGKNEHIDVEIYKNNPKL